MADAHEMKWDVSDFDSWTPEQFPQGMVGLETGNGVYYRTGGWRSVCPEWNADACKNCMFCWINCPDSAILVENGTMTGINYDHCKGCGICVKECPFDALKMVSEHEHEKEA